MKSGGGGGGKPGSPSVSNWYRRVNNLPPTFLWNLWSQIYLKGTVSRDFGVLQMILMDRLEGPSMYAAGLFFITRKHLKIT